MAEVADGAVVEKDRCIDDLSADMSRHSDSGFPLLLSHVGNADGAFAAERLGIK